jgi:hypothetical protein
MPNSRRARRQPALRDRARKGRRAAADGAAISPVRRRPDRERASDGALDSHRRRGGSRLGAIDDPALEGRSTPSRNPVSNAELSRGIARALGRPSWLRVPAPVLESRWAPKVASLVSSTFVRAPSSS